MSTKIFIVLSFLCFFGGIATRLIFDKSDTLLTSETHKKDYSFENSNDEYDSKTKSHKTWYGDTMLVTVDTTYFHKHK
mgnify:CR=1 FL=1